MAKESLSIILPTYNERETVCRLIQKIFEVVSSRHMEVEILVVDDSSPDGTAQTVKKAFLGNSDLRLIVRDGSRSLGASIKSGILEATRDSILLMDADFNHHPEDIPRLLACLDRADIIVGSRFIRGGGMESAPLRYWGTCLMSFIFHCILALRVKDVLSRFILARRKDLFTLDLDRIFLGHGDFTLRFHDAIKRKNLSVLEIPVHYPQRLGGHSKTSVLRHSLQYLWAVLKIRFLSFFPTARVI